MNLCDTKTIGFAFSRAFSARSWGSRASGMADTSRGLQPLQRHVDGPGTKDKSSWEIDERIRGFDTAGTGAKRSEKSL